MHRRMLGKTLAALAGVVALSFPVWGPTNLGGANPATPRQDPTCDPTDPLGPGLEGCIPPIEVPPSSAPSLDPSAVPSTDPSAVPSVPPSPDPSSIPSLPELPVGMCAHYSITQTAGCNFAFVGRHLVVVGLGLPVIDLLDDLGPLPTVSGVPTLEPLPTITPGSLIPSINPSGLPTIPTAFPTPTVPPLTPLPSPTLPTFGADRADRAGRRSARSPGTVVVDIIRTDAFGQEFVMFRCSGEFGCINTDIRQEVPNGQPLKCVLRQAPSPAIFACLSY